MGTIYPESNDNLMLRRALGRAMASKLNAGYSGLICRQMFNATPSDACQRLGSDIGSRFFSELTFSGTKTSAA
jgi:hypothetical protein